MKHVMKVGCLLAGAMCGVSAAFGGSAFTESIRSVSSSGYYSGYWGTFPGAYAFDGDIGTYWLADTEFSSTVEYFLGVELFNGVRPKSYTLSESEKVAMERRPKAFKLYAAYCGADAWIELDSQTGVEWGSGVESKTFEIDQSRMPDGVYYRMFKLVLVEPSGSSTSAFSLSELDMDVAGCFDPDGYVVLDIMETARMSGVENPFAVSSTGENEDAGLRDQLFDGDLTVDSTKGSAENGRALFALGSNPSVTISFNVAAFGNRPIFLWKYGFRMGTQGASDGWNVSNRMPKKWIVYVSDKESPTDDDWVVFDDREKAEPYKSVNNCLSADFTADSLVPVRHVRFVFAQAIQATDWVQLGEICLSGLIGPDQHDLRDVCIYETAPAEAQDDGSVLTSALILQRGMTVAPYDLFAVSQTGERVVTNWIERSTCFTGRHAVRIPGLRLGADYVLRVGAKSANGDVSWGFPVSFRTPEDLVSGGDLPFGYAKLEYLESTDGGCQYVDCGFAPNNSIFGFDFDYIGYNAFVNGNTEWTGNRDADFGVYLASEVKGSNSAVLISSSTGGKGTFETGLFFYGGSSKPGTLIRNERTRITLGEGKYVTAYGATTNTTSISRGRITGPNVFVFAKGYEPNQFAVMRFYSLKTYEDSVSPRLLTHDFVPACRRADGTYGLFDRVDNRWCPAGGKEPLLAGPRILGKELALGSLRYVGRKLSAEVMRGGEEAVDVFAAWGADCGGLDAGSWQHTAKCGAFAAGESAAKFTTPDFGRDTVYVRFYTADGAWSETVYLPDQHHVKNGLAIILK